ncbi:FlgO family outer membrane protein [Paraglaciecola hydrolytica]|uniref:FlgO family outer membrane protein n=1 Tax=Paraglaciecola hydrolytica TaxID=1799789 RepID=UPI000A7C5564|nr:FlgO family outer membrane protein [Paraglaciecola hydrolytica]
MFTYFCKPILMLLAVVLINSCASQPDTTPNLTSNNEALQSQLAPRGLHFYVEQLARQLLSTADNIDLTKTIAVGTILPSDLKTGNSLPYMPGFGLQVQESLVTLSTQAGLKVVEFKTMSAINIGDNYDAMLSRELAALNPEIQADYFLTGTYSQLEDKIVVNIRLIAVPSNTIIAAATDYVPSNAMWTKTKVALKANQIYRGSY